MGEIRDGQEEPEHVNRPEMRRSDDTGAARQRVGPRSRADYAVELERHVALVTFESRRAGLVPRRLHRPVKQASPQPPDVGEFRPIRLPRPWHASSL